MTKAMKGKEIREAFLKYFESKGHTIVPSSSLVPYNDATLLFTNAGMVQFKDVFLGVEKKPYSRAVSAQRCLRAGGKHNDLDTVGRTARHHTFFEMLGNFSFGDYFKRDAIAYAWEFLTEVLELPKEKLYITVFEQDDEAYELWHEIANVPYEKIYRIGAKDNFWAMGDTGPCGPCSEIFFDRGEKYGCDAEVCGIGSCDCDRWMEIWNLVFMQYNRDEEGNLTPLPRPSIDTGMGLERVTSVMQEQDSNYDTDLLFDLIHEVEKLCGKSYDKGAAGFPFRVIADHARSCSFLIADGVMPSNEGRGYVLRRILRRACRLGRTLGLTEPFLYTLVPAVQKSLGDAAPELAEKGDMVQNIIKLEEERFNTTLTDGLLVADQMVKATKEAGSDTLSGNDAFMLYDTYGFPLDLTKDIVDEQGLKIDEAGFEAAMAEQRRRSKESRKEGQEWNETVNLLNLLTGVAATEFVGYSDLKAEAAVKAIIVNGEKCESAGIDAEGYIVLDKTPFYAESGGQLGDKGVIGNTDGVLEIKDTQKLPGGIYLHSFKVKSGCVITGKVVACEVDFEKRMDMARNHSCTHLLQQALRDCLGEHVHQAGSYVGEERLRFDFTHFAPMTAEEIQQVEDAVNNAILANLPISCAEMDIETAKKSGAMAIFGEKYGDTVRVVSMGEYSKELCGGTHCRATGQIGSFKILSEAGIGAGQRRIEALTGRNALNYYKHQHETILAAANILKTNEDGLLKKAEALVAENKALQKELEKAESAKAAGSTNELLNAAPEKQGISIICGLVAASDMNALRQSVDMLRDKKPNSVIVVAAPTEDKVNIVAACSKEAIAAGLNAGQLAKEFAVCCGGNGGGRPDMAQAGGKEPDKAAATVEKIKEMILAKL